MHLIDDDVRVLVEVVVDELLQPRSQPRRHAHGGDAARLRHNDVAGLLEARVLVQDVHGHLGGLAAARRALYDADRVGGDGVDDGGALRVDLQARVVLVRHVVLAVHVDALVELLLRLFGVSGGLVQLLLELGVAAG